MTIVEIILGFALVLLGLLASQLVKWRHGWLTISVLAVVVGTYGLGYTMGAENLHRRVTYKLMAVNYDACTDLKFRPDIPLQDSLKRCTNEIDEPRRRVAELEPSGWPMLVCFLLVILGMPTVGLLVERSLASLKAARVVPSAPGTNSNQQSQRKRRRQRKAEDAARGGAEDPPA